ncbi:MAG: inositol monophosphatase family protein [Acidimicrobiales bacterium]
MTGDEMLEVLDAAATAVRQALDGLADWGLAGTRPGQYRSDLVADAAALEVLHGAGLGVLSEESGLTEEGRDVLVVLDPVDGSTNASRGLPWFASSLCALDADGPLASVVVNQATDEHFSAVRGRGACRNGDLTGPTTCRSLSDALVGLNGIPGTHLGWRQARALGAVALDLCAVACGHLDAYVDCSRSAHGPWDYLGALLVCREAGALVVDAEGRELVSSDPRTRRSPVAAATSELLAQAAAARNRLP